MAETQPINPFAQHYLEITALEPTSTLPQPSAAAVNPAMVVTWPLIIFFGLFITGFLVLFFKRLHLFRSVLMVFVVAFLLGLLPLAMQSTNKSNTFQSLADASITPRNIIVSSVTPTGFIFEWDTDKETAGSLKVGQYSDMQSGTSYSFTDERLTAHHRLLITGLEPGITYYTRVLSETTWFEHDGKPIPITLPSQ